ncbi:MAG: tripartite tricarboxylate transporter substrate binding protein [Betaproteobacteria bacterium]|nr:tripartite tricarboxylate transporter substrate binding protein [Betaproteobacteria bacterium]
MVNLRKLFFVAAAAFALNAGAQSGWPDKPVRIMVPFAPGGQTDIIGRILAERFTQLWGKSVLVENKIGASGSIGTEVVAKSPPDGYMLQVAAINTHGANPALFGSKLPYDPVKDFTPIIWVNSSINVLVVNPNSPFKNLRELIDYAKANPGKLTFGTAGSGSSMHLFMEVLKMMTATDITHVPYKGSGPAGQDVMGNQITMVFDSMPGAWPFVQSGRFRALAVSSGKRAPNAPDVPTVAEAGVPGYDYVSWLGLVGPAGMPRDLVMRINADTNRLLQTAEVKDRFDKLGTVPVGGTPEEFGAYIRTQVATWHKVVRASGAKVE